MRAQPRDRRCQSRRDRPDQRGDRADLRGRGGGVVPEPAAAPRRPGRPARSSSTAEAEGGAGDVADEVVERRRRRPGASVERDLVRHADGHPRGPVRATASERAVEAAATSRRPRPRCRRASASSPASAPAGRSGGCRGTPRRPPAGPPDVAGVRRGGRATSSAVPAAPRSVLRQRVHLGGRHLDGHARQSAPRRGGSPRASSTGPAAGHGATRSGVHSVHRRCPQAVDNRRVRLRCPACGSGPAAATASVARRCRSCSSAGRWRR